MPMTQSGTAGSLAGGTLDLTQVDPTHPIAHHPGVERVPEFVSRRCCEVTGASGVLRVEPMQRLWSGYGQLVRLWLHDGDRASVIAKLVQPAAASRSADRAQQRSHARKLRSYAVERHFYERYAARCSDSCRVARALLCEQLSVSAPHWLFVLEDLDAAGFSERRFQLPGHGIEACLGWLAHFHATFMAEPPDGLWKRGTYWHLETRPDELARGVDAELRAAAGWLDTRLRRARYQTFVHGDAKLENFCFSRDLRHAAAVDFQYVGAGCGMQDVAYLFSSCLPDGTAEVEATALLDHYFQTLRAALAEKQHVDAAALEAEWRELYPIAWADFARFMSGWAPRHHDRSGYAGRMTALALASLRSPAAVDD